MSPLNVTANNFNNMTLESSPIKAISAINNNTFASNPKEPTKEIHLTHWRIRKVVADKRFIKHNRYWLVVEGILVDPLNPNPNPNANSNSNSNAHANTEPTPTHNRNNRNNRIWHSSVVARRVSSNSVATFTGTVYVLHGAINRQWMDAAVFDDAFVQKFEHGFPDNWVQIVDKVLVESKIDSTPSTKTLTAGSPIKPAAFTVSGGESDDDIHSTFTSSVTATPRSLAQLCQTTGIQSGPPSAATSPAAPASIQITSNAATTNDTLAHGHEEDEEEVMQMDSDEEEEETDGDATAGAMQLNKDHNVNNEQSAMSADMLVDMIMTAVHAAQVAPSTPGVQGDSVTDETSAQASSFGEATNQGNAHFVEDSLTARATKPDDDPKPLPLPNSIPEQEQEPIATATASCSSCSTSALAHQSCRRPRSPSPKAHANGNQHQLDSAHAARHSVSPAHGARASHQQQLRWRAQDAAGSHAPQQQDAHLQQQQQHQHQQASCARHAQQQDQAPIANQGVHGDPASRTPLATGSESWVHPGSGAHGQAQLLCPSSSASTHRKKPAASSTTSTHAPLAKSTGMGLGTNASATATPATAAHRPGASATGSALRQARPPQLLVNASDEATTAGSKSTPTATATVAVPPSRVARPRVARVSGPGAIKPAPLSSVLSPAALSLGNGRSGLGLGAHVSVTGALAAANAMAVGVGVGAGIGSGGVKASNGKAPVGVANASVPAKQQSLLPGKAVQSSAGVSGSGKQISVDAGKKRVVVKAGTPVRPKVAPVISPPPAAASTDEQMPRAQETTQAADEAKQAAAQPQSQAPQDEDEVEDPMDIDPPLTGSACTTRLLTPATNASASTDIAAAPMSSMERTRSWVMDSVQIPLPPPPTIPAAASSSKKRSRESSPVSPTPSTDPTATVQTPSSAFALGSVPTSKRRRLADPSTSSTLAAHIVTSGPTSRQTSPTPAPRARATTAAAAAVVSSVAATASAAPAPGMPNSPNPSATSVPTMTPTPPPSIGDAASTTSASSLCARSPAHLSDAGGMPSPVKHIQLPPPAATAASSTAATSTTAGLAPPAPATPATLMSGTLSSPAPAAAAGADTTKPLPTITSPLPAAAGVPQTLIMPILVNPVFHLYQAGAQGSSAPAPAAQVAAAQSPAAAADASVAAVGELAKMLAQFFGAGAGAGAAAGASAPGTQGHHQ
ncbi:hypothetical protein BCR44DRAFT_71219 [Catenaria anguillulae PL171]|uniref:SANTA domain-containing protein n=1 Tax=Catenaria anguillulae PL171 TaxID=765915 RepID=A0A1Y2HEU1_9FUNG|nr:hypothetical protein BCR44DRAFT_71219 [Catenaria anguillulae PL171]